MTIASELTALQGDITSARAAVTAKGGSVTSGGGSSQLATDIATIPTGITPSGTLAVTENGTYDVTNYASANVNIDVSKMVEFSTETIYVSTYTAKVGIGTLVFNLFSEIRIGALVADEAIPSEAYALVQLIGSARNGASNSQAIFERYNSSGVHETGGGEGGTTSVYPVYGKRYRMLTGLGALQ